MKQSAICRLLCLVLSLLMVAAVFAACGNNTPDDGQETLKESSTQADKESETIGDYLSTLPSKDFGEEVVTVLCRSNKTYEIISETMNGDLVNDAIYARNGAVGEKYNVSIDMHDVPGTWNEQAQFITFAQNSILGGDQSFDIIAGYLAYCASLATQGLFANLNDFDSLDMSKPWWAQGFVENNTLNDRLFVTAGDISLTMWESIYAFFYNKKVAEDNSITGLYDLVKNKEWTYEMLQTFTNDVYSDLNGSGIKDNGDLFGYLTNRHSLRTFITSFEMPMCTRTEDGSFELSYYSDKLVDLFDETHDFIIGNDSVFTSIPAIDEDYTELIQMFSNNQGLFMSGTLDVSTTLRDMKEDFGILPFPLYDEDQDDYRSHAYDGMSIFAIPSSIADRDELAGTIMEALCAESCYSVVPAFYDSVLKLKVTRDEESIEMLQIIREKLYFDFGFVHAVPIGGLFQLFGDQLLSGSTSIASYYQSNQSKYNENLEKILEAYEKIQ